MTPEEPAAVVEGGRASVPPGAIDQVEAPAEWLGLISGFLDAQAWCPGPEPAHTCSRQRLVIGSRRSLPKPFAEIFVPGGYWRRLYSAVSTSRRIRVTSASS